MQLDTYLYIIFNLNIYYLTILCNFFNAKFQSSQLPSVFWREMLNIASCFKLKNNRLINLDFNIDKNIIIIVIMFFFHNRASLHHANRIRVWWLSGPGGGSSNMCPSAPESRGDALLRCGWEQTSGPSVDMGRSADTWTLHLAHLEPGNYTFRY